MFNQSRLNLILFFLLLLVSSIAAQNKPQIDVNVGGTIQGMFSYSETAMDTNQAGFGIRRARLKLSGSVGDKVKGFVQVKLTTPGVLDAMIDYLVSDNLKIRVGKYKVAGVLAGGLTSHHKIDIIEFPRIGQVWGVKTVGKDYRDYGVSALGNFGDFNYFVSVFNGAGTGENIIASQKEAGKVMNGKIAISGLFTFVPKSFKGLNIGGYFGVGNSLFNDYTSYSAHIYWEPRPIRIKAEYVEIIDKNGLTDVKTNGFYIMGAYGIHNSVELLARYEMFDPITNIDNDEESYITIGASYFLYPGDWYSSKITAAYVIHNDKLGINNTGLANNVFYMMFQLAF